MDLLPPFKAADGSNQITMKSFARGKYQHLLHSGEMRTSGVNPRRALRAATAVSSPSPVPTVPSSPPAPPAPAIASLPPASIPTSDPAGDVVVPEDNEGEDEPDTSG
ncbi:hypothetical protein P152DRAFT_474287 [Eremomyces bilateralis CBS 781.70]|uniref:Uncharacterized protein n=1 Tax=Eremomyces bilateralis CBS 781.70 TaxID=1392243 RepID=A0A6G1G214_9PEZI|nr:uncharacterized protein P152DRAFT_474287 [Eremomyces bilateralis CBS 781.70]KAF1812058.1 hypothetical protein P152DRAFT_474287 [Eremomyces bilateralis CBS 781.70]